MSTNWGYGCATCGLDERVIIENCRSPDVLARWLVVRGDVAAFSALLDSIECDGAGWYGTRGALRFAAEHIGMGHEVRVVNEYGLLDGQCYGHEDCPTCGHWSPCGLSDGHDGPCKAKGRT